MENTVCHFELAADDLLAASKFYGSIFGWTIRPAPGLDEEYLFIRTSSLPGAVGGGLIRRGEEGRPPTVFFTVESAEETARRIEEQGGTILQGKTPLPQLGWTITARDPQGNTFGLFQADEQAK